LARTTSPGHRRHSRGTAMTVARAVAALLDTMTNVYMEVAARLVRIGAMQGMDPTEFVYQSRTRTAVLFGKDSKEPRVTLLLRRLRNRERVIRLLPGD